MRRALAVLCASAAVTATAAADELTVTTGGRAQTDLQLRLWEKARGGAADRQVLPAGPARAQATLALKLEAAFGRWKGVAQIDVVADAFPLPVSDVVELSRIENLAPVRLEANALYVDAKGLFFDGLDLRVGQQVVAWGVGDQFNPTNNLNPDDLRDVLLFGKQAGNFMVKLDWWPAGDLSLTGVLVPVFKPALLPFSAPLGAAAIERLPFVSDFLRWRIEAESAASAAVAGAPTVLEAAVPVLPATTFGNMMWSARVAGTVLEQDLALSYQYGRHDFPIPFANHTRYDAATSTLRTTASLGYPRMHVVGLNAAGEIPLSWLASGLHGLGYRLEAALIIPVRSTLRLTNDALDLPVAPQPAGEYDYDNDGTPGGPLPAVVDDTPFAKWVVGLDYSFAGHVYVNAQWVHGLPDEYGAGDLLGGGRAVRQSGVSTPPGITLVQCALPRDGTTCAVETYQPRIADYLVLGVDVKLVNDALLLRLFDILDLSGMSEERYDPDRGARVATHHSPLSAEGFSAVIYPEVNYNFGNGLDLGIGALLQLGKDTTKFGDPAAGGSLGWMRARMAF